MYSLEAIKKMNRPKAARLHVRLAKATNNPGGHAKDAEKGRVKITQCAKKSRIKWTPYANMETLYDPKEVAKRLNSGLAARRARFKKWLRKSGFFQEKPYTAEQLTNTPLTRPSNRTHILCVD